MNVKRSALLALLNTYHIPLQEWGKGEAKTIEHLLEELNSGEAEIIEQDGKLVRSAAGAVLYVFYQDGARLLKLKEEKQVFSDGRERVRDIQSAPSEKMKPGERPEVAAYRALLEELCLKDLIPKGQRIEAYIDLEPMQTYIKGPVPSVSFPGLITMYTMYQFEIDLPKLFYKPEGYVEIQPDKKTFFIWEDVTDTIGRMRSK